MRDLKLVFVHCTPESQITQCVIGTDRLNRAYGALGTGKTYSMVEYALANQDRISDKFVDAVSRSIETGTLDPDKMYHAVNDVEIHYLSGKKRCLKMIYDEYNGLIDAVKAYYEFGRLYDDSPFVTFEELSEATVALNLNSISYIRMPLAATEAQIARELTELCEE